MGSIPVGSTKKKDGFCRLSFWCFRCRSDPSGSPRPTFFFVEGRHERAIPAKYSRREYQKERRLLPSFFLVFSVSLGPIGFAPPDILFRRRAARAGYTREVFPSGVPKRKTAFAVFLFGVFGVARTHRVRPARHSFSSKGGTSGLYPRSIPVGSTKKKDGFCRLSFWYCLFPFIKKITAFRFTFGARFFIMML